MVVEPKPQQILIVEDDLDLADMLNSYFRVQGYEVLTANRGKDAIRMSLETTPDLVILDIRLGDIDGYEVCRQIRTHRLTAHLPVIFLTERRDRIDKLAGLELGVVDYITKPFDIQELRLRVRNALYRSQQVPQLNAITQLPEPVITDAYLQDMLTQHTPWAVMVLHLGAIQQFREQYGFIASDDVVRAITMMIHNATKDVGGADFIGHFNGLDLVIITQPDHAEAIQQQITLRLQHSLAYFYPLQDRPQLPTLAPEDQLHVQMGIVEQSDFDSLEALKIALLRAPQTTVNQVTA